MLRTGSAITWLSVEADLLRRYGLLRRFAHGPIHSNGHRPTPAHTDGGSPPLTPKPEACGNLHTRQSARASVHEPIDSRTWQSAAGQLHDGHLDRSDQTLGAGPCFGTRRHGACMTGTLIDLSQTLGAGRWCGTRGQGFYMTVTFDRSEPHLGGGVLVWHAGAGDTWPRVMAASSIA